MDAAAKPTLAKQQVEQPASAVWIVAGRATLTNELLVGALHERGVRAQFVEPARLSGLARRDDVVLARLDVRGHSTASRTAFGNCAGFSAAGFWC